MKPATNPNAPIVVDKREFPTALDAALHLLWLIQRLSYYEAHRAGQPTDGPRIREAILESRALLEKLGYGIDSGNAPTTNGKQDPLWMRLCTKYPRITIPNPLWWIVGYLVIYPARRLKDAYRKRYPLPKPKHYCGGCGKDEGDSLWGFCSPECLEIIANKKESHGQTTTH